MNRAHRSLFLINSQSGAVALLLLSAALVGGCRTSEPTSASFASVTITGRTPEEICQTAGAVFQENGYMVASLNPSSMLFQKEGSRGQSIAYSGVVDTHYGAQTAVRVKAAIVSIGGGRYRLQCNAFMVRNATDSFFEEESPLLNIRSRPYQKLLDQVEERLK